MTTTIYQKFISQYAEIFTLVEITDGKDFTQVDLVPVAKVQKLTGEQIYEILQELMCSENEKASWSDGEEEFDEEDARATDHQKWDEIDAFLDSKGL